MNQRPSLQAFIADCEATGRLRDLWSLSLAFFHGRGVAMVSYHADVDLPEDDVPSHEVHDGLIADGFPKDWICQYIEGRLSRIDPFPDLAAKLMRPFRWSEISRIADLTEEQKHYMDLRAKADLGDGLAMEVYGPNMRNAIVGLGFGTTSPELSGQEILELHCAAQMAHIRFCQLTSDRRQVADLSPRELQVLRWMAKGKSTTVIAEIMGISRHTVDTMTRRVFDKLDVNDRVSAALRGLGSGLLGQRDIA